MMSISFYFRKWLIMEEVSYYNLDMTLNINSENVELFAVNDRITLSDILNIVLSDKILDQKGT